MSLHKTLYCENCGAAEPLRGQQGDPTRILYAVQMPLGVGKDHEDIFPLICMDCETYASFSLTADGLVELYDFALLTSDIHLLVMCLEPKAKNACSTQRASPFLQQTAGHLGQVGL